MQEMIVVLDFGSQYNQLIVRRIRECGVYAKLYPHTVTAKELMSQKNVKGIILSGGPESVYDEKALRLDLDIFELGIPILGICYGMQYIAHTYGGSVEQATEREYGKKEIEVEGSSLLFKDVPETSVVWMSHGDHVTKVPNGFSVIARTNTTPIIAIEDAVRHMYGLQFHPEVQHSMYGATMLQAFVVDICQCEQTWTMEHFISEKVEELRATIGNRKVLCALSGGVDSSVTAALLHEAIGDQLYCIFVDHGLLRKGEGDAVMEMFSTERKLNMLRVDAKERFLSKLQGVTDPEEKRKIIGNEFIYVFEDEQQKLKKDTDIRFLAQGTLYTDIIESGTATAQTIKSHHNVGGLPEEMDFELIEPLNMLFKDEVRALGIALGLDERFVWRQPFPGPGLAIRILGDVTEEKLHIVRETDAILREEIANAKLDRDIWQYFTVLTNMKSVGVMGDQRTYDYTLGIRAVTSVDGMTADFARIPFDVLQTISVRMVNEVQGINRIVYDITSKPPSTIEWE